MKPHSNKRTAAFVYPRLSQYDLGAFRLGGHGLGNLLFCWASAYAFATKHDLQFLDPAWGQIKLSTILGRFGDRRHYFGLFQPTSSRHRAISKTLTRARCHKVLVSPGSDLEAVYAKAISSAPPTRPLLFEFDSDWTQNASFTHLYEHRSAILEGLKAMRPSAFKPPAPSPIAIHVRMGDLPHDGSAVMRGEPIRHHSRIPIEYYVEALAHARKPQANSGEATVYSDASDQELAKLLSETGVTRSVLPTAFDEMIAMSTADILVASGSSFSMWASFLGNGRTIWPPLLEPLHTKSSLDKETAFSPGIRASSEPRSA